MKRALLFTCILITATFVWAQDQGENEETVPNFDDPFAEESDEDVPDFEDPFAEEGEEPREGNNDSKSTDVEENGGSEDIFETDDFDSLFEDEDMIEEVEETEDASPEEDLLVNESGVTIGGSFESSLRVQALWNDYPGFDNLFKANSDSLIPKLEATLFFDARPDPDFRVFGKTLINYPFLEETDLLHITDNTDDPLTPYKDESQENTTLKIPNIEVKELFADFDFADTVFFRSGKFGVKWGVGYFYSPADVINLSPIDPEDPEAEREGPFSIKTQVPFDLHNIYLYIIAKDSIADDGEIHLNELAVAPKFEFFLFDYEFGIGGHYQMDLSPKAMLTFQGPIWDFDIFGEGVFSYGTDRVLVREAANPIGYEAYTESETFHFDGSGGIKYMRDFNNNAGTFNLIGQYLFQSDGYSDASLAEGAAALFAAQQAGLYQPAPVISSSDLSRSGKHYLAASTGWSDIFDSDLGISLLWQMNLSDGSGVFIPNLSWKPFDYTRLELGTNITYGEDNREFTAFGRMLVYLTAKFGIGEF